MGRLLQDRRFRHNCPKAAGGGDPNRAPMKKGRLLGKRPLPSGTEHPIFLISGDHGRRRRPGAAFADGEAQTLANGDRLITRHPFFTLSPGSTISLSAGKRH